MKKINGVVKNSVTRNGDKKIKEYLVCGKNKFNANLLVIKNNVMMKIRNQVDDEEGMGVVEIVLIVLVLVGLAFIFKKNITGIVEGVFKSIKQQVGLF